jgi:hypothetical protein
MADKEIIKCTQCKKKFFEDGFNVSRLGVRNKTCKECAVRKKAYNEKNKDKIVEQRKAYKAKNLCEHGIFKNTCYTCASGNTFCHHRLPRARCFDCTPSNFCEHSRHRRLKCQHCNPEFFCLRHVALGPDPNVLKQIVFCRHCNQEKEAEEATTKEAEEE